MEVAAPEVPSGIIAHQGDVLISIIWLVTVYNWIEPCELGNHRLTWLRGWLRDDLQQMKQTYQ
jgi:hypothetical protein